MSHKLSIFVFLIMVSISACTSSAATQAPASETVPAAETTSEGTSPGEAATFPVTIEHKFGQVTIPAEPLRVITLGFSEQDPVLALGVKPVAVREWFGDQPFAVWPWAQDELGNAQPEVLNMPFGELDYEKIASLRPDLIVATHSGITEEEYETLSRIAPTLAQSGDYPDFGMPWEEQLRSIAKALGREARAEQLIADMDAKIAQVREAHPEFEGATVAWASPAEGQGQYWAVGPTTPPMKFLASLGFRMPGELAEVVGDKDSAQISGEQFNLLDADVLIFQVGSEDIRQRIENDPLYQQLDVARRGGTIFFVGFDDTTYGALSFSTVLSLEFALENLVPRLADALGGETAASAFPVTVQHKFGSTTIPEAPERVIALGYNEQDAILALGVRPIAVRYWFGDEPHAVFPWARDELGDAEPEVLNMPFGELDFEKIAALQPDLISAVYAGITEEEYETLSRIAPTVAQSGDYIDFGMPWQEATILIGRALGRAEQAEELVAQVEALFEAARQAHPEWQGKTVVVGAPQGDQFAFMASGDARARVFTSLGFRVPEEFDEIAGDQFWGTVSLERADLLDQDLLVFHQMQWVEGGREAIQSDPLLSRLDAMEEGRVLFIEGEMDDALQFGTVLSLPFLLDDLLSRLEVALDGDPATEANP